MSTLSTKSLAFDLDASTYNKDRHSLAHPQSGLSREEFALSSSTLTSSNDPADHAAWHPDLPFIRSSKHPLQYSTEGQPPIKQLMLVLEWRKQFKGIPEADIPKELVKEIVAGVRADLGSRPVDKRSREILDLCAALIPSSETDKRSN